jgi:hypothetical protein
MKSKAGIWIDRQHAILVAISSVGQEISHFAVGEPEPFPTTTESIAQHHHTPNDFQAEDRTERKEQAARQRMYDAVLSAISGVESLFILGPGEAKKEFAKHIESKRLRNMLVEIETSDKMTEPQLAAKVRQHFANSHNE